jgi:hypothetical protein
MSTIAVNAINPPSNTLTVGSTGQFVPAVGTTAERPTAVQGGFRFNTTTTSFEGYDGTEWAAVGGGGGATGGGSDEIFIENGQTVTTSYSIPAGKNAGTFGPVSIDAAATVTVPSGSVWTVV